MMQRPAREPVIPERQRILVAWNATARDYPRALRLHDLFAASADRDPAAIAVVGCGERWSYGELARHAHQLAHHLRARGVVRGTPVAVWMDRSPWLVAALLAIVEAGGHYVPLEPRWPLERARHIAAALGIGHVLTDAARLKLVTELQAIAPGLREVVVLDADGPRPPDEPVDRAAIEALFDEVASRGDDPVASGGFVSSYDGEALPAEVVEQYRRRVVELVRPHLGAGRLLEIGCGSGLALFSLAAQATRCVGLDPSPETQARNRRACQARGLDHVELVTGYAHEIDDLVEGRFDVVLIASTAQFFPGPCYLRSVIERAARRLVPGGAIVVADVMDAARKLELAASLARFRSEHGEARTRTRLDGELHVDATYFGDLANQVPGIAAVEIRPRGPEFEGELGFRYDVVLRAAPPGAADRDGAAPAARPPVRRLWTRWHVRDQPADRAVDAPGSSDDLAYIIHTSGSTGAPKGVMVAHRAVVNLIDWVNRTFAIGPADRVLFVTSPCFDLSVYDVFGLLAAGGSIHVASERELRDPAELARLVRSPGITFWDSAPAALEQLVPLLEPSPPAPPGGGPHGPRLVFLSGDWIPVSLPDQVRARFPGAEVVSLGGATEATVWSNFHRVGEVDPAWPSIPYGRPIQNARYYIVDDELAPCPPGVAGQLLIGGDCLALGYAGDPRLTAAKLIPDPFSGLPGARLYRTGDLARFHADGVIEFLGRDDHQVKIRGFRIELGEIEAALARHPGVRGGVAVARDDGTGKRLVAYHVPLRPGGVTPSELRDHLARQVPEYMVPAAFVELPALPLTGNGKIDRAALPAPPTAAAGDAPATPTEIVVARIWAEVLGLPAVGRHDGFLELGGHSLLATRMASRVGRELARAVPLAAILQAGTVARLAALLDAAPPSDATDRIPRRRPDEPIPLTLEQERVWFLGQLHPGSLAYNAQVLLHLRGALDIAVLERALSAIVERHEIFRTTFEATPGGPRQRVHPAFPVALELHDLQALPEAERLTAAHAQIAHEIRRPFDVGRLPLFRWLLYRITADYQLLVEVEHHFIHDGWSVANLLTELRDHYTALVAGRPVLGPALPVQYADYAIWQRRQSTGAALAAWAERLAGHDPIVQLPTDRPRPPVFSPTGDCIQRSLPATLSRALRAWSERAGVTLFVTLATAFSALVARYSGQRKFVLGSSDANRRVPETEPQLGMFVNTLAIPVDLTGDAPFSELVQRFRATAIALAGAPALAIDALVSQLGISGDLSRNPLCQVSFSFHDAHVPAFTLPGVTGEIEMLHNGSAKFDLNVICVPWAEQRRQTQDRAVTEEILVLWEYCAALFERATMARMFDAYVDLLQRIVDAAPRLSALLVPPAAELRQLETWSTRSAAVPAHSVVQRFEAQAAARPDAPALYFDATTVRYAELDRRANQLARRLRAEGVGSDSRVAVCMERSIDLVIALVAILKAGAAYVPIDPAYPLERIELMLRDSAPQVAVVHDPVASRLPAGGCPRLVIDAGWRVTAAESAEPLGLVHADDQVAYVIYTSGSTGAPKGAMNTHGGCSNHLAWLEAAYGIGPADRVLLKTPVSFDASVWEIFLPLVTGAAMVIAAPDGHRDPAYLIDLIERRGVTVAQFVPTLLRVMLDTDGIERCAALRHVMCGGEVLPRELAERCAERLPAARLHNLYGPTEASVDVAAWTWQADDAGETVPIGRPVDNVQLHILDPELRRVAIGAVGELFVAGAALARGYHGRPGLTAERFVPDPFGRPGTRMYRTGDLCRHRGDGAIEFVGRADHQVKIRGHRIELGEVEHAVRKHPAVRDAVVIAADGPTGKRLIGYVVPHPDQAIDPESVRELVAAQLPDALVPAAVIALERFPALPNGKLDRAALPVAAPVRREATVAARDPLENVIAMVFSDLLAVTPIGVGDSFFALGGHSILAMELVAQLEAYIGVRVPLVRVFQNPTVESLAAALRRDHGAERLAEWSAMVLAAIAGERETVQHP